MVSAKDLLEGAERRAPVPTFTLGDLDRRRDHLETRRRVGTAVVALTLVAIAFGSVFTALREPGRGLIGASGPAPSLPPATRPAPVAAPGQYYSWAVRLIAGGCLPAGESEGECGFGGTRLDVRYVWSPHDDSGRIEVLEADGYGIEAGSFAPGGFPNPNGIDVSTFPLEPEELAAFLLDRSAEDGASPAPLVTPPPEGGPNDGQLWRAITDLLQDPHVTPPVRAALLETAAELQGARVVPNVVDPVGRPAHAIAFGNWGGDVTEHLYVDPDTHELLAWTARSTEDDGSSLVFVVRHSGVVDSPGETPSATQLSFPAHHGAIPAAVGDPVPPIPQPEG